MKTSMVLTIILALICFAAAGFFYVQEQQFLAEANTVTGTVITFQSTDSGSRFGSRCPVIEYTTLAGETKSFVSNLVCGEAPPYDIGQQIKIHYHPDNPDDVQLGTFWGKYIPVGASVAGGVFILLLGFSGAAFQGLIRLMIRRGGQAE